MIRLVFLVIAIVLFLLVALKVIDHDVQQWAYLGFASFAASFLPWDGLPAWPHRE